MITLGNPFNTIYKVEVLSLLRANVLIPPKPFDCSGGLAAFRFFLYQIRTYVEVLFFSYRKKNAVQTTKILIFQNNDDTASERRDSYCSIFSKRFIDEPKDQ